MTEQMPMHAAAMMAALDVDTPLSGASISCVSTIEGISRGKDHSRKLRCRCTRCGDDGRAGHVEAALPGPWISCVQN